MPINEGLVGILFALFTKGQFLRYFMGGTLLEDPLPCFTILSQDLPEYS